MKKFMAMAVLCLGIVASVRPAEAEVPEEPKDVFADVAEFIDALYFRVKGVNHGRRNTQYSTAMCRL